MTEPGSRARIADEDAVVVTVLDPPGFGDVEAWVADVSKTRLRVLFHAQIPRDAYVVVRLKGYLLFGEIDYCGALSGESGAFDAGLVVEESLCLNQAESSPVNLTQLFGNRRSSAIAVERQAESPMGSEDAAAVWRFVPRAG